MSPFSSCVVLMLAMFPAIVSMRNRWATKPLVLRSSVWNMRMGLRVCDCENDDVKDSLPF